MTWLLFVTGLGMLIAGAEALVRGAGGLATRFGIPPLVVGLTVVAFGTSSPEMAVSVSSALGGQASLAVGNVVGSNIFNVLLILGVSAAITPLTVARQLVRLDVPVMVAVSGLLLVFAGNGVVGRGEGLLLFAGIVAYIVVQLRAGGAAAAQEANPARPDPLWLQLALIAAGLGALVLGSRWLVAGAVSLARSLGLSELIIGLTIVAAGTSLPEVAASVVAALRGQRDIAVGNVVGSNIFNILAVLGASAAVSPAGLAVAPPALAFDIPVMVAVAVACLPIFFTGHRIDRWEGWLFLVYYVAYTLFLVLDASDHEALPVVRTFMVGFAAPLTAVTLVVLAIRSWRDRATTKRT